jgi:predicted metal-dependent phosphoesterase TrpH
VDRVLATARELGLGGIAITDHDRLVGEAELGELARRFAPLRLFTGIEVTIGEEHVLVHGVRHHSLESRSLSYPDLWRLVRAEGGLLTIAHPFRYKNRLDLELDLYPPDLIEIHSVHTGRCHQARIEALARRLGIPTLATSDAHDLANIGIYHVDLTEPVEQDGELVSALRRGAFRHSCRADRVRAVNSDVELREAMIREMLAAGQDKRHFRETTGQWEGFFECVEQGNSYLI